MDQGWEATLLGETLANRYAVEEPIGRGGMSVVFRAADTTLGRPVAVKVMAPVAHSAAARERLRERFRREAGAAAGIPPHPNLVHIYDYGTDPRLDVDFIVMELLRGRDLKAALAGRALEAAQALRVLRECARGLAAGHRAGIVHRDVKPANVFLVGEAEIEGVRLLDFGIAKALDVEDDLTQAGELPPHSPAYASPEQLRHGAELHPASDVFQLGLVGYELLAGARPFSDEEWQRLRRGEAVPVPERGAWPRTPRTVRRVVERCLDVEPARRYPDGAAVADALADALAGPPATAPPAPATGAGPAALAPGAAQDVTLLEPASAMQPAAEARPAPVGVEILPGRPTASGAGGRGWHRANTAKLMVAAALMLVLAWTAMSLLDGRDDGTAAAAALDIPGLDERFRALQHEAAHRVLDEPGEADGAEAAAEVRRVIADLYQAWTDADLDRFATHYADRVDYHGRAGVRRGEIVRDRSNERERFEDARITIDRTAIELPEPGRARAVVDRSWRLRGPEIRWDGAARQQLVLERQRASWVIVAEDELEVYDSDCSGC